MSSTTTRLPMPVRVVIVLAAGSAIWQLMSWINATVYGGELTVATRFANAALVCGLTVAMVYLARKHLDKRPWAGLGLGPVRSAGRPFLIGMVAFLVPSAVGLGVALVTGWVELTPQVSMVEILSWVALLVVLVFVFEALPEELIFRGYLQRNLMTAMSPWMAAAVQALMFTVFGTALWVVSEGWGVLAERGILFLGVGFVLGLLRIQTGSVWTPIGFHLAFQVVAQNVLSERFVTNNEPGLMAAAMVSAFVFGSTITELLHKGDINWRTPEPDEPAPAESAAR